MQPGIVKRVQESKMAFKCMENINSFLEAAKTFGVPSQELFQTVDLWERQNLNAVVICLQALGRKVIITKSLPSWMCKLSNLSSTSRLPSTDSRRSDPKKLRKMPVNSQRNNWGPVIPSFLFNMDQTKELINQASISATLDTCKTAVSSRIFQRTDGAIENKRFGLVKKKFIQQDQEDTTGKYSKFCYAIFDAKFYFFNGKINCANVWCSWRCDGTFQHHSRCQIVLTRLFFQ